LTKNKKKNWRKTGEKQEKEEEVVIVLVFRHFCQFSPD